MPSLTSYKGMQVVDPASGTGGAALTANFKTGVDWHPRSEWAQTVDPGTSNNQSQNFYPGSWWLNSSSGKLWLCTVSSPTTATWKLVATL
jgi:hypothetical protein